MARDHALMYVLSAIIILNIIAIVLLQNRLPDAPEQPVGGEDVGNVGTPDAAIPEPVRPQRALVRALILEHGCDDCYDISSYLVELNDTIDMETGTAPAAAFDPPRLPAIAFNASIEEYPNLVTGWDQIGTIVEIPAGEHAGKWYVLPTMHAPFLENGTVHGRVTATYLVMGSCEGCYEASRLRDAMADVGITPYLERTVDAETAAGRALVARYNITAVPTLIMDEQARFYALQPGWDVVGTIEEDGSYVLRDLQRMQVAYYDLGSKRLMKP